MKKIILSIIYFLACIFSIKAQVLYCLGGSGGNWGAGTLNKFMPGTNTLTVIKIFKTPDSTDGSYPSGSLVQANDGKLYGMMRYGGSNNMGVIYSFDPSDSSYTKLKDFDSTNGGSPRGSLMQAKDGKLYGMTEKGGSNDYGVIFSFDLSTLAYSKMKDFGYTDGAEPIDHLIQAINGKLYGMTHDYGEHGAGIMFSIDPSSFTFTKLKDFAGNNFDTTNGDGSYPASSLIQARDGKLYGMTSQGGSSDKGVIFSFDPSTSAYTKLKDFDGTNGGIPLFSLLQASDGKLYGMTTGGGEFNKGVIFSFDPFSSTYTMLWSFNYVSGPNGDLMQASDGRLYGTLYSGGISDLGGIFSFDLLNLGFGRLRDNGGIGASFGFTEVKECMVDTTYYRDADSDGYGNPADSIVACTQRAGFVANNTDCVDTKATVHPGATEICGNGIDDNCNEQIDENCQVGYTVSINDVTVNESQGVAKLTVTLSAKSTKPVWLLYYTKDGTATGRGWHKDYETRIGWLYIRPGSLTGSIYIKIMKDRIAEPTEYFDVILYRSLNATIADGSGRVFISGDMQNGSYLSADFNQKTQITSANSLEIKIMPNPTTLQFNLRIESNNKTGKIDMKVMDVQGKLIETRNNLLPGQTIRIGSNYRPGTYFIQAMQGEQRRTIEVIKISE